MLYQVRNLNHPGENDPTFDNFGTAVLYALEKESEDSEPVGVWTDQDKGSVPEVIIRGGEVFWPPVDQAGR